MGSERLDFIGSTGATLSGRLELPDVEPRAFALFAHCFTCGKDALAASRVARALTEHGYAVLRFDFTGIGGSEGDFANTTFSSNVLDLVLAGRFLAEHHRAPSLLIGHSMGGAAVLAAAEQLDEVRAVATIAAPADTDHLLHLLHDSREQIESSGEAEVCLAGRSFRLRREFLDDLTAQPQSTRIRQLGAALMVMHSPRDEVVDIDNARRIFRAARHPKSFVSLDGADHLLTTAADAQFAADVLAAWAARYLDEAAASDHDTPPASDDTPAQTQGAARPEESSHEAGSEEAGTVGVAENGIAPYGQQVRVGRHSLSSDEPEPLGRDSGPSPYDLLLAGLGACTSMTLRMYADRKQWPLDHVSVTLRHARIHARDCEDCETTTGHLDRIERVIDITGDLDDEQRSRLHDIADKCPVHRTLHGEVVVDTTLADEHSDQGADGAGPA